VELFGVGWGLRALTFGLGVDILGSALGFTFILGLAASAGTLIPMVVLSSKRLLQPQGPLTIASLILLLGGIRLCSWGGRLRDMERTAIQ
jgi:L-rhamnose-H+ transport protein